MNIKSENYARKFQNIDSEIEEKILIRSTHDNHRIRKYSLGSWKDESKAEKKRSTDIWKFKEDFILKKSYRHNDSYKKEGTMLQTRDKSANHTVQPKKRRNNCSRKKLQKQNNSSLDPMVKKDE